MTLLNFLPLALVVLACTPMVLASVNRRMDQAVTRVAVASFGTYVMRSGRRVERRRLLLRASHASSTYRAYAAKTFLYSGALAVAGSVLGVYLVAGAFAVLAIPQSAVRETLPVWLHFISYLFSVPSLGFGELFTLLLASSATVGVAAGVSTYYVRWWFPKYVADTRKRQIEESLTRTVAFLFALSRSGMSFTAVMNVLARHRAVYGEAAAEIAVAVKRTELAGDDLLSALEQLSEQTPSPAFSEFSENLASVLRSGRSVSEFMYDQFEHHRTEAEARQERFLQLLETLAEAYVSLLVVGPLLFITILAVMGMFGIGDTLLALRTIVYVAVPVLTFVFILHLDSVTESLTVSRPVSEPPGGITVDGRQQNLTDGGLSVAEYRGGTTRAANVERFSAYRRYRHLAERFFNPVQTVKERPETLLVVTIPIGLAWIAMSVVPMVRTGTFDPTVVDARLVQAALFVLGTFAVAHEQRHRRLERIEAAVPDFLDRLANANDAGMTVAESVQRVGQTDLGALDDELKRVQADVAWGATVEAAFHRFERRIRTPIVTRSVTLVTNAMRSSGQITSVLRIAADNAQAARRLKRRRQQELFTYLVITYLSFAVFLVIIVVLDTYLVPNIPTPDVPQTGAGTPGFGAQRLANVDRDAYTLLLNHTALIQALCSGFVAGQMGEGSVKNGAKHATVLLASAYVVLAVL